MLRIQILEMVDKVSSSIKASDLSFTGKYPVYGAQGIAGYNDKYQTDRESIAIIKDGAGVGRVQIIPAFSSVIGTMQLLIPKKGFDVKYLYYMFTSLSLGATYSGATIPHIYFKDYGKTYVASNTYEMQKKISEILSKISKIIDASHTETKLLDELTKSRFIELFGNPDLSFQNPEWQPVTSFSQIVTGTTPSTGDPDNWDGDVLWVTPAEIKKDAFYLFDTERKLTEKGRKSKSLSLMPVGTVILSTRAPIGKVAIVGKEMACNQGFKNFICKETVNPVYLYFLLRYNTEYLNSIGSGTTFKEVSKSKIEALRMPIPEKSIQNEFSLFVEQIDKLKFIV